MWENKLNFELLAGQRKVGNMINSKTPSAHKMQPLCKLEALNPIKGRTVSETDHSSHSGRPRTIRTGLWPVLDTAWASLLLGSRFCSFLVWPGWFPSALFSTLFLVAQWLPLGFSLRGLALSSAPYPCLLPCSDFQDITPWPALSWSWFPPSSPGSFPCSDLQFEQGCTRKEFSALKCSYWK